MFPISLNVDIGYAPRLKQFHCPTCKARLRTQYQLILIREHPKLIETTDMI